MSGLNARHREVLLHCFIVTIESLRLPDKCGTGPGVMLVDAMLPPNGSLKVLFGRNLCFQQAHIGYGPLETRVFERKELLKKSFNRLHS